MTVQPISSPLSMSLYSFSVRREKMRRNLSPSNKYQATIRPIKCYCWTHSVKAIYVKLFLSLRPNVWGLDVKNSKIYSIILYLCQVHKCKTGHSKAHLKAVVLKVEELKTTAPSDETVWASEEVSVDGGRKRQPWQYLWWDIEGELHSSRSFWAAHPRGNHWHGELRLRGSFFNIWTILYITGESTHPGSNTD